MIQEVITNALVPLSVDDAPAGMSRVHFLEDTRRVAIGILKKGLEAS